MAIALQNTVRATMWRKLSALTDKAVLHEQRQNKSGRPISRSQLLQAGGDTTRKSHDSAKRAAHDPFAHGLTKYTFNWYCEKILRNRVSSTDLDDLEKYFYGQFWPLETVWIDLRKKEPDYKGVMEELLERESLTAMSKDLELLLNWSKAKIRSAYDSNDYIGAIHRGEAILFQISELQQRLPESFHGPFWLLLRHLNVMVATLRATCGVKDTPLYRKTLMSPPSASAAERRFDVVSLMHMWCLEYVIFRRGKSSAEALELFDLFSGFALAFYQVLAEHNRAAHAEVVRLPRSLQPYVDILRATNGISNVPGWLIDDEYVFAAIGAGARVLDVICSDQDKSVYQLGTVAEVRAHRLGTLAITLRRHRDGKVDDASEPKTTPLAITTYIEESRIWLQIGDEPAELSILNALLALIRSNTDHLLTWYDAYVLCGEFCDSVGNHYGAIRSRDRAIQVLKRLKLDGKLPVIEAQRECMLLEMPKPKMPPNDTLVKAVIDFVDWLPPVLGGDAWN